MSCYKITSKYRKKVEEQFKQWASFLNNAVGLLSFTLGLACLGTQKPSINAAFCLIVVTLVWSEGRTYFPKEVSKLRLKAKKDPQADLLLKGLVSKHLGMKNMLMKYPLYLFGYIFLVFVAVSNWLNNSFDLPVWFVEYFNLS